MIRTAILVSLVTVLAGCERSARTVEVQPPNQGIKPDTGTGGDTLTKTGRLALELTGFASSASSADVKLLINDDLETQVVSISGGSGTALVSGVMPGSSTIKIRASAGSVTYSGSTSVIIRSGELVRANVQLTSSGTDTSGINTGGTNTGGTNTGGTNTGGTNTGGTNTGGTNTGGTNTGGTNTGGTNTGGTNTGGTNTGGSNNGSSDLDISIDIGGNNSGNTGGNGGTGSQNIWDGKSFKGNSMFSIEPVK